MATVGDVESTRGRKKLVDNGFQYVLDKRSRDGQKLFWRCDKKHNGCPVRLHTKLTSDEVVKRMHDHNHGSDAAVLEVNRIRTAVKRRPAESTVEVGSAAML